VRANRNGSSLAIREEIEGGPDADGEPSDDVEELSEIREIFESIQDVINSLFRYSIIIRNNTNRDRYAKPAAAAIGLPFNDEFGVRHVIHKFPVLQFKKGGWLIERLGKAITQRRQYLRYCRAHHDRTWQDPEAKPTSNIVCSDDPIPQAPARLMPSGRSNFSKPTSTLAPTQASTLLLASGQAIEDEMIEETQSRTSYATSTDEESNNHKLRVIQLEDVSKGSSISSVLIAGKFRRLQLKRHGSK
jgi:hypothetical protein